MIKTTKFQQMVAVAHRMHNNQATPEDIMLSLIPENSGFISMVLRSLKRSKG